MIVNSNYNGAGRLVALIVPKNGCRLSARVNIIAARGMHSNDVPAGLQTLLSINTLTCYTRCCDVTLAAERQIAASSRRFAQTWRMFIQTQGDLCEGNCSASRNPCITSTDICGATSMHVSHGTIDVWYMEPNTPPRERVTSGRVLEQECLVLVCARDREL